MLTTNWPLIEINSEGVAYISGMRTRVLEVVMDHLANGWDADQIHRQYPHISRSQIHAALGFYFDNKIELDRVIEQELREIDRSRESCEDAKLRLKLRTIRELKTC